MNPIIVGISGGSGAILAKIAVESLLSKDIHVIVTASSSARQMWLHELGIPFSETLSDWEERPNFTYHNVADIGAPIASGGQATSGMLIIPSSMATVAAIAHGFSDNLLRRAADVTIKERRPLIVLARESPLSAIHLENLLILARLGVVILPPAPAFYLKPETVQDVNEYIVEKALDVLGVPNAMPDKFRYGGREEP
ncbi:MAG: UbiX family flavin prenyltransferase [SAR202 cluster bacterium]|nr:UbiX family flavin prenyltransferase [SAR202 cluster bacterium]|tara:strand:- start:903 stop:1493 length:591 start_codon:yes stop_codon:yes gene_type:complete